MATKNYILRKKTSGLIVATALAALLLWLVQPSQAATITVAAGVVVINGADGQCSLIEAVANTNDDAATHADCPAGSGADTIELAVGATYDLTSAVGGTALPLITDELTINGHDATIRKVVPANFRLMRNARGNILYLNDLILHDGIALTEGGGAIYNSGHLTVRRCTFSSNYAQDSGGAIFVDVRGADASLAINRSSFDSNGAAEDGGAILMSLDGTDTFLQINNSVFTGNSSGSEGGAIHGDGDNWRLEVLNSTFTGNYADSDGGAIYFFINPASGVISYSTFSNNEARNGSGGAIFAETNLDAVFTFDHLTMNDNVAAAGGALGIGSMGWGSFHVTSSTLDGNSANYGGAIRAGNTFTLTQVALTGNSSTVNGGAIDISWGGLSTAIGMIEFSEISGNTAIRDGGGIALASHSHLTLSQSTLSGNEALLSGGAIENSGTLSVTFATIIDNHAGQNGGGFRNPVGGTMIMRNTALLGNVSGTLGTSDCGNYGTFTSLGYNRYSGSVLSGCGGLFPAATDAAVIAPSSHINFTLADNGGPTRTHAIVQYGDLHNQIPDGVNSCKAGIRLDQRGHIRANGAGIGGNECDVGAYEYAAICATPVAPNVAIDPAGADVNLSWTQPAENFYTELWRTSDPYFDPTTPGNQVPFNTLGTSYTFADQLGDVKLNRFYTARGVAACGDASTDVDRVGEFDFALVPGS